MTVIFPGTPCFIPFYGTTLSDASMPYSTVTRAACVTPAGPDASASANIIIAATTTAPINFFSICFLFVFHAQLGDLALLFDSYCNLLVLEARYSITQPSMVRVLGEMFTPTLTMRLVFRLLWNGRVYSFSLIWDKACSGVPPYLNSTM